MHASPTTRSGRAGTPAAPCLTPRAARPARTRAAALAVRAGTAVSVSLFRFFLARGLGRGARALSLLCTLVRPANRTRTPVHVLACARQVLKLPPAWVGVAMRESAVCRRPFFERETQGITRPARALRCTPPPPPPASFFLPSHSSPPTIPTKKYQQSPGDLVLVAGATGGVGQLVVAKLLDRGFRVRGLTRSAGRARAVFLGEAAAAAGAPLPPGLELVEGDTRSPSTLPAALAGVDAVACCTGTTAFPSARWKGGNGPKETDEVGVANLVAATKKANPALSRFILTSSAGVERAGQLPYSILNLFGVLNAKAAGEAVLRASGLPATILRPGRLTDGPYTSYDLNTLFKATAGPDRAGVRAAPADCLDGQTSRVAVAEALVQCLGLACTEGAALSLESCAPPAGGGPGTDAGRWEAVLCGGGGQ
jgi:hypothetical protein